MNNSHFLAWLRAAGSRQEIATDLPIKKNSRQRTQIKAQEGQNFARFNTAELERL